MTNLTIYRTDDDDRILKDGETLRTRMTFMDSQRQTGAPSHSITDGAPLLHRPGFVAPAPANDAQTAAERYRARDAKLGSMWRDPPPEPPVPAPTPSTATHDGDIWAARDRRLEDAWRNA